MLSEHNGGEKRGRGRVEKRGWWALLMWWCGHCCGEEKTGGVSAAMGTDRTIMIINYDIGTSMPYLQLCVHACVWERQRQTERQRHSERDSDQRDEADLRHNPRTANLSLPESPNDGAPALWEKRSQIVISQIPVPNRTKLGPVCCMQRHKKPGPILKGVKVIQS